MNVSVFLTDICIYTSLELSNCSRNPPLLVSAPPAVLHWIWSLKISIFSSYFSHLPVYIINEPLWAHGLRRWLFPFNRKGQLHEHRTEAGQRTRSTLEAQQEHSPHSSGSCSSQVGSFGPDSSMWIHDSTFGLSTGHLWQPGCHAESSSCHQTSGNKHERERNGKNWNECSSTCPGRTYGSVLAFSC